MSAVARENPADKGTPEYRELLTQLQSMRAEQKGLLEQARESREFRHHPARETVKRFSGGSYGKTTPDNAYGPFKTMGGFLKGVREVGNGHHMQHPQMKAYCDWMAQSISKSTPIGMSETVLDAGGVLVPPQFTDKVLMRVYANDILSRVFMLPMTALQLKVPAINESSRADGSRYGGVNGQWEGEGASLTTNSQPAFEQITLSANELRVRAQATNSLLEDAGPALETILNQVVSSEFEFKIGAAIIGGNSQAGVPQGTGAGMPLGILNSPALIKVSRTNANKIAPEDVTSMWARLWIGCHQNAVWLYNVEALPQLQLMTIGLGVSNFPVYLPPGGLSGSPFATLMGRPLIPSEFCAALGTSGDLILWDPSTYLWGNRSAMQSAVSIHVLFDSNQSVFRFIMRADGRPWWLTALTPFKGTNTLSCIVTM